MPDLLQRLQDALSGRYRIERTLGGGGMATVFLAEDLKHHRRVAIKVLSPEVAAAIGPKRFLREIETVAKLTHPHILPLHDSGAADGLLFYVMPYVEGESLRDRLTREKQLPLDDALRIAREVSDALGYAHAHGLVHRDIKPENVLLESGHAVVADFGIARTVTATGEEKLTTTGVAVGTPTYMSPEQAAGSGDVDGRSDLYSLGCVLYEMLAGQPPFMGPTAVSLAYQHLNLTPRPVTELRPAVPAVVAAALQRALAKTPADRFNPVALFGEALGSYGTGTVPAAAPTAATATPKPRRGLLLLGLAAIVVMISAVLVMRAHRTAPPAPAKPVHGRGEVAVLPLQNLSAGGPRAYFADGLHEELLTQLAKVAALKVISRTSVMGYEGTRKPLKEIAAELGVGSIVEGSVQVEGERLRVNVQLIDAATDEHLWAERYDRTLDDAFAIQSDVAQRIVEAVGATLGSGERQAITEVPTANPEAYLLYLQGEVYRHRPGWLQKNLISAVGLYERAVALDQSFALAHAALSIIQGRLSSTEFDPSGSRAARQRAEARIALRLAPHLPQAHVAMAWAYNRNHPDYRRVLDELRIALSAMPNDAESWVFMGAVHRRLGNWAAVDSAYRRATQLDPRNVDTQQDLGGSTFLVQHRYSDAIRACDRALSLAPDVAEISMQRGWTYFLWKGDLDSLRVALHAMGADEDLGGYGRAYTWRARWLLIERRPDSLLALVRTIPGGLCRSWDALLPTALYAAWAHRLRRDDRAARGAFGSALDVVDSLRAASPEDFRIHASRGLALAGLARRTEALREVRWLQASAIYRDDAMAGPILHESCALILAQLGEADAALDEIERLLAGPSWLSVQTLRFDPRWDAIREHPRFKALLVKYANPERRAR